MRGERNVPNFEKFTAHADKRGRLITQPPKKLATSATQTLCKSSMF